MDLVRGSRRAADLDLRRHLPAFESPMHLRRGLPRSARRACRGHGAGVLQLRRPFRRRPRRTDRGHSVRQGPTPAHAIPRQGGQGRLPAPGARRRRCDRHRDTPRGRRLHLLESTGIRGWRRVRAAHRCARCRRTSARLEAQRVLAGADAARALDRRQRPRHLAPARVEASGLGRGRLGFPLVVHRGARGVQW